MSQPPFRPDPQRPPPGQPPYGQQPPPGQPPYGQQPPPGSQPLGPPPQPMAPMAVPTKPAKQKQFGWVALIVTALVSLGIGGAVAGASDTSTSAQPAPTVTVTETEEAPAGEAEPAPTVTVTKTTKPEPEPEPEPEPDGLSEGTYEVGVDAKAGRYKTTVPDDSMNCYWQRTKDDSGEFGSIIANDNASPGSRVSVTLKKGEFFTSNGCGDWVRQ